MKTTLVYDVWALDVRTPGNSKQLDRWRSYSAARSIATGQSQALRQPVALVNKGQLIVAFINGRVVSENTSRELKDVLNVALKQVAIKWKSAN